MRPPKIAELQWSFSISSRSSKYLSGRTPAFLRLVRSIDLDKIIDLCIFLGHDLSRAMRVSILSTDSIMLAMSAAFLALFLWRWPIIWTWNIFVFQALFSVFFVCFNDPVLGRTALCLLLKLLRPSSTRPGFVTQRTFISSIIPFFIFVSSTGFEQLFDVISYHSIPGPFHIR